MLKLTLKHLYVVALVIVLGLPALAVERRHGYLAGKIVKLDAAAKTLVIKLADGTEHTLHFSERSVVHGVKDAGVGAKDTFHGLKEGSEVAVHYTAEGTNETAEEIDHIGKDGLQATEATIMHIDRGAKTLTVKTASGAEETYHLTDSAAKDAGKDIAKGTEKSAKVTVYSTEEGGRKVAHFFKRAI
jgi:hypothetical protein